MRTRIVSPAKGLGLWIVSVTDRTKPLVCKQLGATWVALRSGGSRINPEITQDLIASYQQRGLRVFTWNYSVPGAAETVQQIAHVAKCFDLGADGHILDAETEWETKIAAGQHVPADRRSEATDFAGQLRAKIGEQAWLAHAPWWLPKAHPQFPFFEFDAVCDAIMPQTYWTMRPKGQTAAQMLDASEADYAHLDAKRDPKWQELSLRSPIGDVFDGTLANGVTNGQASTPADVSDFIVRCEADPTLPFWSLYDLDSCAHDVYAMLQKRALPKPAP